MKNLKHGDIVVHVKGSVEMYVRRNPYVIDGVEYVMCWWRRFPASVREISQAFRTNDLKLVKPGRV